MELCSIIVMPSRMNAEKLAEYMKNAVMRLYIQKLKIHWNLRDSEQFTEIVCTVEGARPQIVIHKTKCYDAAAEGFAAYIVQEEEMRILVDIIQKEYGYDDEGEIGKIIYYCKEAMNEEGENQTFTRSRDKRMQKIAKEFGEYLTQNGKVNLDGFLAFRMNPYMEELREIVDYAIDEYLMEKQYQEFISLLKYFVYIQESKIPAAHLMHKGENDFVLLNERMQPIETKHIGGLVVEMMDKDINYEDMIVSTLISVSPQKVYIHTREPEQQVIKTIQQIFENRTTLCTYCSMCKPILGKKRKNRLYP